MTIEPTIWHVTETGTIHKGFTADCSHCRWTKSRKKKAALTKKSGSSTSVNRGGRKKSNPPRKCARCNKDIHRNNKSGFCLQCLNLKKAEGTYKPKKPKRLCSACDKPIASGNRSGLCRKCWVDSPRAKEARQNAQAWVNAAVFNRNATPPVKAS